MEAQILKAHVRTATGTRQARAMRDQGQLPGVIYGRDQESLMFAVDRHEVGVELLHGQRLLSLDFSGKTESFLVREVQYDHLGTVPLHLDLVRVNLHDTVTLEVAVELVGTPRGATLGGVLDQLLSAVEIACRASDIPDVIKARVHDLEVGQNLTVGDLELPEGIRATTEPTEIVATVRVLAEEAEPEEGEEEISAEPEVISKGKAESEASPDRGAGSIVKLVFGLGNPGTRYEDTRHNLGFMLIDELARRHGIEMKQERFHAWFGTGHIGDHAVALAKPTTFMNRSGQSVSAAARFYKITAPDLLIVVDDMALETGRLRFRPGGRDGGHKGLANIAQQLGTSEFPRLRVGIGGAEHGATPHVLGRITEQEWPQYDAAIRRAADGVTCWLDHGMDRTMNRYNGEGRTESPKPEEHS